MELNLVLEVISTVAVIIGIIFGLNQLRQYRLSRKRDFAQPLLNSYTSSDYVKGIWIILSLPDGLTKKEIEERVGPLMSMASTKIRSGGSSELKRLRKKLSSPQNTFSRKSLRIV